MPKLDGETAKRVATQGGPVPPLPLLPAGNYVGTLLTVDEYKNPYGSKWWVWQFEVRSDQHAPRVLSFYTSLRDEAWALWKLKRTFSAFRVPCDTNTDELVGQEMELAVSHRMDDYVGELVNRIDRVLAKAK